MTKVIMVRLVPGEPTLVRASRASKAAKLLKKEDRRAD
jgi:hypothetical protein